MADVNSGLGGGRTLRIVGTHNYAVSLDKRYSSMDRFSLVRDPVQCLSSVISSIDSYEDKGEEQYKTAISDWINFHEKILEDKNINLVWCKDLKFRPLETFTKIITDVLGLEMLRDTIIGHDTIQDKNYRNSNFNTPQYRKIHRYVSSTDLSQPYYMYSELVKRSIHI